LFNIVIYLLGVRLGIITQRFRASGKVIISLIAQCV
jgi:hypothetical protein